jgi:hypothetical protein
VENTDFWSYPQFFPSMARRRSRASGTSGPDGIWRQQFADVRAIGLPSFPQIHPAEATLSIPVEY